MNNKFKSWAKKFGLFKAGSYSFEEKKIAEVAYLAALNSLEKKPIGKLIALPIYSSIGTNWDASVRLNHDFDFEPSMQNAKVYIAEAEEKEG